jgi:N-acetylmuramoyl-L-alanine amidase
MILKRLLRAGFFVTAFVTTNAFCLAQQPPAPKKPGLSTIILDAGHGGGTGSKGWNGVKEEAVALGVALKLEKEIQKLMPGVAIHQTRTEDVRTDNRWRADFANEKKGDVFVSIHCNIAPGAIYKREVVDSVEKMRITKRGKEKDTTYEMVPVYKNVKYPKEARGMETYVWEPGHNSIKLDAAKKGDPSVADVENQEIYNDPDYKQKYGDGLDINSAEFAAKTSMRTKRFFRRSVMLANLVQEEGANAGRNDRNIRQRGEGIWVLQATNMPSVLVETGYISHPVEEAYLASDSGQQEMAEIIAKAIKRYHDELVAAQNAANQPAEQAPASGGNPQPEQPANNGGTVFFTKPKPVSDLSPTRPI